MSENNHFDFKKEVNIYMHYYQAQTMINASDKTWSDYNKETMTNLSVSQNAEGS